MALVLKDRVQETTSSPGTGAAVLLGAVTGYQTFGATMSNGDTTYYTIADQSGSRWEVGIGTYVTSGNEIARTTILASSNAGSTVNFNSGTQVIFLTYPAEIAVLASNNPGTSGQILTSQGAGVAPVWATNSGATADDAYFLSYMMG